MAGRGLRGRNEAAALEARALANRTADEHKQEKYEWTPPNPRVGRVILWAPEAGVRLGARHAELPQVTSERAGGWRTIPRQQHRPITAWDGYEPLRERIVLWLDGWMEIPARSVDPQIALARRLTRKVERLGRPPWLRAIGIVPYPGTRWVVEQGFSVEELEHRRGRCVRAKVTVPLLEWVNPEIDLRVERQRAIARQQWHEWEAGDTLAKVAKRYLGDKRRADDVRAENPKIRRWSTLRVGTRIKIPAG